MSGDACTFIPTLAATRFKVGKGQPCQCNSCGSICTSDTRAPMRASRRGWCALTLDRGMAMTPLRATSTIPYLHHGERREEREGDGAAIVNVDSPWSFAPPHTNVSLGCDWLCIAWKLRQPTAACHWRAELATAKVDVVLVSRSLVWARDGQGGPRRRRHDSRPGELNESVDPLWPRREHDGDVLDTNVNNLPLKQLGQLHELCSLPVHCKHVVGEKRGYCVNV
jgi:hypothetical protein